MSELNPKARALIRSTQFADEPTEADYDRVHSAIEARIALGVAVGAAITLGVEGAAAKAATVTIGTAGAIAATATATATTVGGGAAAVSGAAVVANGVAAGTGVAATAVVASAAGVAGVGGGAVPVAAAAGTALLTKVAAWVVVASAVAVGTTAAVRHESQASTVETTTNVAPHTASTSAAADALASSRAQSVAARGIDIPPPPSPPRDNAAPSVTENTGSNSRSAARPAVPVASPPSAVAAPESVAANPSPAAVQTPLDTEVALLRGAREALREGQGEVALATLDGYAHQFPNGALAEDCAAERIFVLCALGRVEEARAEGTRFLAAHPRSSYAMTVRSSCAIGGKN